MISVSVVSVPLSRAQPRTVIVSPLSSVPSVNSIILLSTHFQLEHSLTIVAGDLDAGGGREEAVAALATAHAGRLEDGGGVIIMKWIVAGLVGAVIRNALEAVYAVACRSELESARICEQCPLTDLPLWMNSSRSSSTRQLLISIDVGAAIIETRPRWGC